MLCALLVGPIVLAAGAGAGPLTPILYASVPAGAPLGSTATILGSVRLPATGLGEPLASYRIDVGGTMAAGGLADAQGNFAEDILFATPGSVLVDVVAGDAIRGEAHVRRNVIVYPPPASPAWALATWTGGHQVALAWAASPKPAGAPEPVYDVERNGSAIASTAGTTLVDLTPTDGSFSYSVRARNPAGSSAPANATLSFQTPPPAAPGGIGVVPENFRQYYRIQWSAPDAGPGVALAFHKVEAKDADGTWSELARLPGDATAHVVGNFVTSGSRTYRVSASHTDRPEEFGAASEIVIDVPYPPSHLVHDALGCGQGCSVAPGGTVHIPGNWAWFSMTYSAAANRMCATCTSPVSGDAVEVHVNYCRPSGCAHAAWQRDWSADGGITGYCCPLYTDVDEGTDEIWDVTIEVKAIGGSSMLRKTESYRVVGPPG